jgi:hypothetical protein
MRRSPYNNRPNKDKQKRMGSGDKEGDKKGKVRKQTKEEGFGNK